MKKILLLLVIIPINLFSQNIIWSENFESYTNGTQNTTKWTTTANNCDNDGAPGIVADNYWGTRTTFGDKEFCCEDIEGLTCCSSGTSGEGNSDNVWLSEIIDISGNQNISISITMRAEGNMECTLCGTGNDQFTSQYQIDGGSWITFLSVCGFADGQSILECVDVGTGTNLRLRVLVGNQANTEEYYFDDVFVYEGNCAIVLPVQLSSFSATEIEDGNKIEWITESENGSSHFELYKSIDGQNWENIATLSGAMNTTQTQRYIHIDNEISSVVNYYKLFQFDVDGEFETFGPISVQNSLGKVIIGNENIIGQKVNKDYRGLVVVIWSDGSKELIFRP